MSTDSFQGTTFIRLQPSDLLVPYKFTFSVCSSSTANDGSIPYGDSVNSCDVTAHAESDDSDVTDELIANSFVSENVVTVNLNYPSTTGEGKYHLTFVVVTNNGSTIEFDFNRIIAKNI